MENSLEFLTRMHEIIKDRETYPFICSPIALEMAKRLVSEGKKPSILLIESKMYRPLPFRYDYLEPRLYNGKVKWGWHHACCEDGKVYDPLSRSPLPMEEYLGKSFVNEAGARVVMSFEDIIHDKRIIGRTNKDSTYHFFD